MAFSRPPFLRSFRKAGVLVLCSAVTTTGCYTYQRASLSELKPDMTVRAELTAVAVDRFRNSPNGERRLITGFEVDGLVASASADSVIVSVPTSSDTDPLARGMVFRQPITLRQADVQRVDLRTLDRRKTAWTSAILTTLGLAAAVYAIRRGGESSGSTPVPGGPNEVRVPAMLRWAIP